jgi:antitoxin CptB
MICEIDRPCEAEPRKRLCDVRSDALQRLDFGEERIQNVGPHRRDPSAGAPDCLHGLRVTRGDFRRAGFLRLERLGMDEVLRALRYRAWHRGTREADMMIGGYFDAHHASWDAHDRALFAALLTETDVDIMAWAIGTQDVPERYEGPMMDALQRLDFIKVAR